MRVLSFDSETYLITNTDKAPKPIVCSWHDGRTSWVTHPAEPATYALWEDPDNWYTGVNIAYDLVLLMRWYPHFIPHIIRALDEGRVRDLPLRDGLVHLGTKGALGYNPQISLADLAKKHLGLDLSATKTGPDIWRLRFGTLDGVPFNSWPAEAMAYVLEDARIPWVIFNQLGGATYSPPTEVLQNQAAVVLNAIGTYGWAIDQDTRQRMMDLVSMQITSLENKTNHLGWTGEGSQKVMGQAVLAAWNRKHTQELLKFGEQSGVIIDPAQWRSRVPESAFLPQLIESWATAGQIPAVYQDMVFDANLGTDMRAWLGEAARRLTPVPMTKKGISVAEEALEPIADVFPDVANYLALKHKIKMRSTYLDPYAQPTIHPRYVPLVSTCRTGCRNPNNQNIPRKDKERPEESFRTMFKARPGRKLGTSDYSQLELCTLSATIRVMFPAVECKMGDAIDRGMDVHAMTASSVTGMAYEQILAMKKTEGSAEAKARQASKAVNFGRPGGLGAGAFQSYAKHQYGVEVDLEQSKKLLSGFDKTWPEVRHYLNTNGRLIETSPEGRVEGRAIDGFTKASCIYTELSNLRFQALAASGAKAALWAIWRESMLGWFWRQAGGLGYGAECRESPLCDSRMVGFIHDEIVSEMPDGDAGKAALERQNHLMVVAMTATCQNKITIRVESGLSDRWEH